MVRNAHGFHEATLSLSPALLPTFLRFLSNLFARSFHLLSPYFVTSQKLFSGRILFSHCILSPGNFSSVIYHLIPTPHARYMPSAYSSLLSSTLIYPIYHFLPNIFTCMTQCPKLEQTSASPSHIFISRCSLSQQETTFCLVTHVSYNLGKRNNVTKSCLRVVVLLF